MVQYESDKREFPKNRLEEKDMNNSMENLTHKMQRAAVGKMVDVVLSRADKEAICTISLSCR